MCTDDIYEKESLDARSLFILFTHGRIPASHNTRHGYRRGSIYAASSASS